MKSKDSGRGMAIVEAIKSESIVSLAKEIVEITADSLIDSEALKQVPMVNIITGVVGFTSSVRDNFLASKLVRFLNGLSEMEQERRSEMIERLNEEDKYRGRVGSALVETLDRMESEKKPELAAKCFVAFAKDEITFEELRRILFALEKIPSFDVEKLGEFIKADFDTLGKMDESLALSFVNAGLGRNNGGFNGGVVVPTGLCNVFVAVILD